MGYRVNISKDNYLKGLTDATQKLQDFVDNLEQSGGQGLADIALHILGEATQRAPVDTGNLRGSGYVELNGQSYAKVDQEIVSQEDAQRGIHPPPGNIVVIGAIPDGTTCAEVGFNAKYAADQHEQTFYNHPHGGEAKYLERVIVDEQGELQKILLERLRRVMSGGGDD